MSNAKIVSLIAHETRRVQAEDERARTALAVDLYDGLRAMVAPLIERLEALALQVQAIERDVEQLKAHENLQRELRTD